MYECYDIETNQCDGSCQGCSDCPLAQGFNLSRRMMKTYIKYREKENKEMEEFMNELLNDAEFMNEIKEMMSTFRKSWIKPTPITGEQKEKDMEELSKCTEKDINECIPFGEPVCHINECEECRKELKPDSSYYADDGDRTFWYTDRDGSRRVCKECYCDLMAGDYSNMN